MKFIRNPWFQTGTAVLSLLIAACSSKTEDNGTGVGGVGNSGTGGAVNLGTGGRTATPANLTGGQTSTPDTAAGETGGAYVYAAGGSSAAGFDPATYCGGIFQGKSCGATQVSADVRVVNMLLVLDSSGSMGKPATTGGQTKWAIMQQALTSALTKVENDINFGLLLYPYKEGGIDATSDALTEVCAVPADSATAVNIPIGSGATAGAAAVQAIIQKVQKQTPAGGTPTADALARAFEYFSTGDGRALPGTRWVILATDGGPNCNQALTCTATTCTQNMDGSCTSGNCCADSSGANKYGYICLDDAATGTAIDNLAKLGVKTFVVGIPGSEAYASYLNVFATKGKVPNNGANGEQYYPVSAATALDDLTKAFESITTKLVTTCDIPLSETPKVGASQINVAVDCNLINAVPGGVAPAADASTVDGFYIDFTQDPAHLKLVGSSCTKVEAGAHQVDIIAGCQTIN